MKSENNLVELALSRLNADTEKLEPTFVVLTGDEKRDVLYPSFYGPFESFRAAYKWVAGLRNAYIAPAGSHFAGEINLEPVDGGYMGFVIVSESGAEKPEDCYLAQDESQEEEDQL